MADVNISILKRLLLAFFGFGILMGGVFPVYASFFVDWKEGMFIWFVTGCLVAGIVLGLINYFLVKIILLKPISSLAKVAEHISKFEAFTVSVVLKNL
ncbi:MAG: hypothetical protein D6B28_00310 [Gammaproteobacteria bacterium]|nr:MAG: hypothetical protein D6B28_00310 [Gammaproteobacteria bacterium]